MPKPLHIFLVLVAFASVLLCFYAINFDKNVTYNFSPKLIGWSNRELHSSQDAPVTSLTSTTFVTALKRQEQSLASGARTGQQRHSTRGIFTWIHIAVIYCNAANKPLLKKNFEGMVKSLAQYHRPSPKTGLHFHLITDAESSTKSRNVIESAFYNQTLQVEVSEYLIEDIVSQHQEFIETLQQYFSAKPGSYYGQALFYVSLQFYRILPSSVSQLIFLDIDTRFRDDIIELYKHFTEFDGDHLLGLASELSPVYRHILYIYRGKHKETLLGEPKGKGFPGFNSGLVLMDLDKLRASSLYSSLLQNSTLFELTTKYSFKGHLGDQDFYTLIAMEHPELFYTLPCTWNRQLCQWWKNRGYEDVFNDYFDCKGRVHLYHGNCNTPIPEDAI